MTNSNARLAVDLDDIERQLRQGHQLAVPPKKDPLAELARIVGQDDPFRTPTAMEASGRGRLSQESDEFSHSLAPDLRGSLEPHDLDQSAAHHGSDPAQGQPIQAKHGMADLHRQAQFDAPYRSADEYNAYSTTTDHADGYDDAGSHYPARSRKGLIMAGALLGVTVLGIAGTLVLRNQTGGGAANNGPLVVQADKNPLKIQPDNPGGVDIPNQNKQIYERGSGDGQTRVVNREEQPMDVQQAARAAAQASVATPGASVTRPVSTSANNSLTAGLGEPKRVRTVSVPVQDVGARQPSAAGQRAGATDAMLPASTTPAPPQRPIVPPAVAPVRPAGTPDQQASGTPQTTSESTRPDQKPPQRLAAAPKVISAPEPAGTGSTAAAAGGFAVQLAVRPSEKEARTAYQQLQQRFADDLHGRSPAIRQAEVNGKTVYRVRIGPMSRDDASNLCSKLKTSGGQCFVANN